MQFVDDKLCMYFYPEQQQQKNKNISHLQPLHYTHQIFPAFFLFLLMVKKQIRNRSKFVRHVSIQLMVVKVTHGCSSFFLSFLFYSFIAHPFFLKQKTFSFNFVIANQVKEYSVHICVVYQSSFGHLTISITINSVIIMIQDISLLRSKCFLVLCYGVLC